MKEHITPHAPDVEMAVLGCILKDESLLDSVTEILDSEDIFYSRKHRAIYREILRLYRDSKPCDVLSVAEYLSKREKLESIGGRTYLVEMVESIGSTANVMKYAEMLANKFLLRQLIRSSTEIIESCYNETNETDAILDRAEQEIFAISEKRLRQEIGCVSTLVAPAFERIEKIQVDGMAAGIKTGFTAIDTITSGLRNGNLIIVAGRPSMGKSALALNIADYVATELKKPVALFSIEMSNEEVVERLLCARAKVSGQHIRSRRLTAKDWSALTVAGGVLSSAQIFIDDSPLPSSFSIRAKARRLKSQHDIALIIVDYIQMINESRRFENRQQEMANISLSLKALAKELNVPVIACSQLSRQVEQRGGEKRPQLSDLRESGAIEQDADIVMFIYRPEQYYSYLERTDPKYIEVHGKAEIIMAKHRNGPTGLVNLTFLKEFTRFENMAPSAYNEVPAEVETVESDIPF